MTLWGPTPNHAPRTPHCTPTLYRESNHIGWWYIGLGLPPTGAESIKGTTNRQNNRLFPYTYCNVEITCVGLCGGMKPKAELQSSKLTGILQSVQREALNNY